MEDGNGKIENNKPVMCNENINYSTTGLYTALPSDLKSKIINTRVVSGHDYSDNANFTTTDKIYLFSTKEIWGKEETNNVINYDSAEAKTRQLDYYKAKGVTTSNYQATIKNNLVGDSNVWWLRSVDSHSIGNFYNVNRIGNWGYNSSGNILGVSPAFRIRTE